MSGSEAVRRRIRVRTIEAPMAELLERDVELATLRAAVAAAAQGAGSVVLVAGEAGIGKSSLVQAWASEPGTDVRVLTGWCEDFLTSRPLGPFHDVARAGGGPLAAAVDAGDVSAVLEALLAELDHPVTTTGLLLEDLHWADDATLDVVRYVGRRIHELRAVLVLTYRDDELAWDHPLTGVLGALAAGAVHRITLRRLSVVAVARLTAGSGLDPSEVARVTGGNPFFVAELASSEGAAVPASVGDAVLARVRTLPERSREAVGALAVIPGEAPAALVDGLVPDLGAIAAAEQGGVLRVEGTSVRFRHELARRAVLASLPVTIQVTHHRTVLEHLLDSDADPARILHHAVEAGRIDVIASHGPRAAAGAYRAGAYREAVAHGERVLEHPELLAAADLARLLEEHAWALYHLQRLADAAATMERAAAATGAHRGPRAHVRTLLALARMRYLLGGPTAAAAALSAAEAAAAPVEDPAVAAEVDINRLVLLALSDRHEEVVAGAEASTACAREVGRVDLLVDAEVYTGMSQVALGEARGFALLEEGIRFGRAHALQEPVARGYVLLVECLLLARRWEEAERWIDEAVAFYERLDFRARAEGVPPPCPGHRFDTLAQRARLAVLSGSWQEAAAQLQALDRPFFDAGTMGVLALEAQALLAVRRGAADAPATLRRAWEVALVTGSASTIVPVACAGIEQAWLAGRPGDAAGFASVAGPVAGSSSWAGPLRWRLQLVGEEPDAEGVQLEPEGTSLRGEHEAAARAWSARRLPFEQGIERLLCGSAEAAVEALGLFERLGAEPAAHLARRRLRALGVRHVPRGPAPASAAHPFGLTVRQAEVLDLLAEGCTNADIAERLVVSVRTVDHHVSTVLRKLGVSSRKQAAALVAGRAPSPPVTS